MYRECDCIHYPLYCLCIALTVSTVLIQVYHSYPHLSNMSTATYTQTSDDKISLNQGLGGTNTLRGNSFYSLNSNASHHSQDPHEHRMAA